MTLGLKRTSDSDNGFWRGYKMVAARINDENRGLRIHLQAKAPDWGTLCGSHLRMEIADFNVATGWPDCEACVKAATEPPKPKDKPADYGWSPA